MKLMFIVLRNTEADLIVQTLIESNHRVTRVASTGGFLRSGNVTLMTGVVEDKVQEVIDLLHKACNPSENAHHSATIFVVDMPYFEHI